MFIRKFVGITKVAGVFGAALLVALTAQTALAHDPDSAVRTAPPTQVTQVTLSQGCKDAIAALKTAFQNDRQQDLQERAEAKLNPTSTTDPAEDAAERAAIKSLFGTALTACGGVIASVATKPKPIINVSSACSSALQAWKAAAKALFTQGSRPTAAQKAQLEALGQTARTACGWPAWQKTEWEWGHR